MVEWRKVPGAERYEVSSDGQVRGVHGQIRRPSVQDGYCCLSVIDDEGYMIRSRVHRLVALAFIGPPEGRCVNHIDGNRSNNALSNLEYVTHQQNQRHAKGDPDYRSKKFLQNRRYKTRVQEAIENDRARARSRHNGLFTSRLSKCGRRPKPFYDVTSKRWRILVDGKRHTLAKTLEDSIAILERHGIDYDRGKLLASLPPTSFQPFTFVA